MGESAKKQVSKREDFLSRGALTHGEVCSKEKS